MLLSHCWQYFMRYTHAPTRVALVGHTYVSPTVFERVAASNPDVIFLMGDLAYAGAKADEFPLEIVACLC